MSCLIVTEDADRLEIECVLFRDDVKIIGN